MALGQAIPTVGSYFEKSSGSSALAGTVSSSGVTLTGTGTAFDTALKVGDIVTNNADGDEFSIVRSIASATSATIVKAFSSNISGATIHKFTYSKINAAFSGSGPNDEASEIEWSNWDSSGFKDFLLGLVDPGSFDCTVYFQPKDTTHKALRTDFVAKTLRGWRLWVPDSAAGTATPDASNSRIVMLGRVKGMPLSGDGDSVYQAALSVRITGEWLLVEGTDA